MSDNIVDRKLDIMYKYALVASEFVKLHILTKICQQISLLGYIPKVDEETSSKLVQ